jgi:hypothetical protein
MGMCRWWLNGFQHGVCSHAYSTFLLRLVVASPTIWHSRGVCNAGKSRWLFDYLDIWNIDGHNGIDIMLLGSGSGPPNVGAMPPPLGIAATLSIFLLGEGSNSSVVV